MLKEGAGAAQNHPIRQPSRLLLANSSVDGLGALGAAACPSGTTVVGLAVRIDWACSACSCEALVAVELGGDLYIF